jgi:hypothetical protein
MRLHPSHSQLPPLPHPNPSIPQVSDDSSSSQDNVTRLGEESAQAVQAIQESIASKKKDVMEMLMYHVTTVKLASE